MEALFQDRAAAKAPRAPQMQFSLQTRISARLRSAAMLVLLWLTIPVSLALVVLYVAWEWAGLVKSGQTAEIMRRLRAALSGGRQFPLGTAIVSGESNTTSPRSFHHRTWLGEVITIFFVFLRVAFGSSYMHLAPRWPTSRDATR